MRHVTSTTVRAPRARQFDSTASHAAADRAEASGVIGRDLRAALKAAATWPACSARQLSERTGLTMHVLSRRLPELQPKYLRRDSFGPRGAFRYFATTAGERAAAGIAAGEIDAAVKPTPREARALEAIADAHAALDAAGVPRVIDGRRLGLANRIRVHRWGRS